MRCAGLRRRRREGADSGMGSGTGHAPVCDVPDTLVPIRSPGGRATPARHGAPVPPTQRHTATPQQRATRPPHDTTTNPPPQCPCPSPAPCVMRWRGGGGTHQRVTGGALDGLGHGGHLPLRDAVGGGVIQRVQRLQVHLGCIWNGRGAVCGAVARSGRLKTVG